MCVACFPMEAIFLCVGNRRLWTSGELFTVIVGSLRRGPESHAQFPREELADSRLSDEENKEGFI